MLVDTLSVAPASSTFRPSDEGTLQRAAGGAFAALSGGYAPQIVILTSVT